MLRLRQDILLFPEGKPKALTLSYDDGVTQDERLIQLMRTYKIKGTFNLNPGLMGDEDWLVQPGIDVSHYKFPKETIARIYEGQEIAVHTMTHPDLMRIPTGTMAYEIAACRKELEDIANMPITGMAYPFGTYSDEVKQAAAMCGITYSRTTKQTFTFSLPTDFLEWHPTCHHTEECMMSLLDEFLKPVDLQTMRSASLYYLWGHAYEFDAHKEWERIEAFLDKASGKEDIWYATNGEICDYIKAAEQLIYSATGDYIQNPTCTDVWKWIDRRVYCVKAGETIKIEYEHH